MRYWLVVAVVMVQTFVAGHAGAQTTAPSTPGAALAAQTMQQWISQINSGRADQVIAEVERRITQQQPASELKQSDLQYIRARAYLKSSQRKSESASAVETFVQAAPKDERSAELLFRLGGVEQDPAKRIAIYQRVVSGYASTSWAQHSKGAIRRIESIGKPFELEFTDVMTGKSMSIQKDLKGKVVVIDFWAGWCGDCAAEMPRMVSLYRKYKDQGVEFIGVSLDRPEAEGGLRMLKAAVDRLEVSWPQYYQGNYFQSEFSNGWGINAIPSAFILDKQGRLVSGEALPQLEKLIPELLAAPR